MIIEAHGIHKSFGTLEVLKGIDFCAEAHEVVSIMGASGAGKSTLLQILGTLSTPDSGSLLVDGVDVLHLQGDALAAFRGKRIGFVFQAHHLLPEFSAEENVMIPALIAGVSAKEARAKAVRLLGEVGLEARLDHKPAELSGGEQQRVAIARQVLDELPPPLRLLFSLRERLGQTIVIVTHDPALAALCDRTLTMQDGRFI